MDHQRKSDAKRIRLILTQTVGRKNISGFLLILVASLALEFHRTNKHEKTDIQQGEFFFQLTPVLSLLSYFLHTCSSVLM